MNDNFDSFDELFGTTDSEEVEEAPTVSQDELNNRLATVVAGNLSSTTMYDPVDVKAGPAAVHIMGRVYPDNERLFVSEVVTPILRKFEELGIDGFVGIQYFLKTGEPRYGWVVSFKSNSTTSFKSDVYAICESFAEAIPKPQVESVPMLGKGPRQVARGGAGSKGVTPVRA